MHKATLLACAAFQVALTAGCRSTQLAHDQDGIRAAVMDLHTNQLMDNLIRIRRGLPILHLDYARMTGTISHTAGGNLGGTQTIATTRGSAFSRVLTNVYNYGASANQVTQLTVTADPVLNAEIYDHYLEFLQKPEHLIETPEPPAPGEALCVRCVDKDCCDLSSSHGHRKEKTYFWVPCAFRDEFFKLALFTIALRGEPAPAPTNFEATVKGLLTPQLKPIAEGATTYRTKIKLDKRIPNDNGYIIANIRGRITGPAKELTLLAKTDVEVDEVPVPGKRVTEKQKTGEFELSFDVKQLGFELPAEKPGDPAQQAKREEAIQKAAEDVVKDLVNQRVSVVLNSFVPTGSRTERLLEDIRHELQLQRLDQVQVLPR